MSCYLGIDLGTSAVKALVLDDEGRVLAKASAGYEVLHPQVGWSEQSPDDWWRALCHATREVLAAADPAFLAGVGLSGQLNGLILLDAAERPLGNALIWLDLRSQEEAAWLDAHHGELLREAVVNPANPIYVGAKLLWLKRHRPELLARARHLLFAKDVVNLRLTGERATDHTDASCTLLYHLERADWHPGMLELLELDPALLPPLRQSTEVIGRVTAQAAAETGIPAGTPVVAGAGDVAALSVGSGAVDDDVCSVTLGTAGHVVIASPEVTRGGFDRIWQMRHAVPARTIRLGLVMSGGLCLSWFRREFGEPEGERARRAGGDPFEALVARAAESEPGARGVVFLPFLEGAATPFQNPALKAGFVNVASAHTKADLVQALLEGVAFNVRDCSDIFLELGSRFGEVRLSEGGSRSARWCQIIADVLERPVTTLQEVDASAMGAALLAMAGARPGAALKDIVHRVVKTQGERVFEPDPERSAAYAAAYARYRRFAAALDELSGGQAGQGNPNASAPRA